MSGQLIPPSNPSFAFGTFVQRAWDSTSLGLLKTCPRKYYYKMIQEWRSKHEAIPLAFGILYHATLEQYDKVRAQGNSHEQATVAATKYALEASAKFHGDDSIRTRFTLVRSILWYLEQFRDDPCTTLILANGKPAVELSFRFNLEALAPDGEPYLLCGHLDRVVMFAGKHWVLDRKTTKMTLGSSYFSNFNPDNQMSLYTCAGQLVTNAPVSGVIIDAAQLAVGFTRFQREIIQRTPATLDEWMHETLGYIKQAEQFAEALHWPMNDSSCSKFGGCEFRNVCARDPSVRPAFLEADFERVQWNPLKER